MRNGGWTNRNDPLVKRPAPSPRIVSEFSSIDPRAWKELEHADNPFLSHELLSGLEDSDCVGGNTGWQPHHLALYEGDELVAFAPTYAKAHSHGEFVFDWAWADAFHRHNLAYYPKLLTAVPYTPVTGPRLLTHRDHPDKAGLRQGLVKLAIEECERAGFSSWHCNFVSAADSQALKTPELLARSDWQFHWRNTGYASFEDFLNSLQSRKRKNILRERRGVAAAGLRFEWKTGAEVDAADIGFIYRCYTGTFDAHGNHAALNEAFFAGLARNLSERFLVCFARSADEAIAASVFLRGGGRLYGRYWGCVQNIPGLHFEAAYYQGIEYCIHHGIDVFESGAQGEHKIARGFLPCKTRSFHFVRHPAFSSAIADFLARESVWLDDYRDELLQHSPYRRPES